MSGFWDETSPVGSDVFNQIFPAITREQLAHYARASGDSNPIHLSPNYAFSAGYEDVFAHGMLVMALMGRALETAVGPGNILRFEVRFTALTDVGAILSCSGREAMSPAKDGQSWLSLSARDQYGTETLRGNALVETRLMAGRLHET